MFVVDNVAYVSENITGVTILSLLLLYTYIKLCLDTESGRVGGRQTGRYMRNRCAAGERTNT